MIPRRPQKQHAIFVPRYLLSPPRSNTFPLSSIACGTGPLNPGLSKLCLNGPNCTDPVAESAGQRMKLNPGSTWAGNIGKGTFSLPTAKDSLDGASFAPTNVAVCFCGAIGGCDPGTNVHYAQAIGTVHFYTSKICRANDQNCAADFIGTSPNLFWKLRISCPAGACSASTNQRFKVIAQHPNVTATSEVPSWHDLNTCRSLEHGKDFFGRPIWDDSTDLPTDVTLVGGMAGLCAGPLFCGLHGTGRHLPVSIKDFPPYVEQDSLVTIDYKTGFRFNVADKDAEKLNFVDPLGYFYEVNSTLLLCLLDNCRIIWS